MSDVGVSPFRRMRRLRRHDFSRRMVAENNLTPADFIYPMFVIPGEGQRKGGLDARRRTSLHRFACC